MSTFEVDVPLRWVDLDAQAHVNNAIVVDLLQEARVHVLLTGPVAHLLGNGIIVVGHQVEYLAPIAFTPEPVRVRVRIGDVGASRLSFAYELTHGGRLVARARTDACVFDWASQRPRRMTDAEAAWFRGVAEPVDPWPSLGEAHVGDRAHEHPLAVRWSDVDGYGHVNNVRMYTYVGEARVAMQTALIPDALPTAMDAPASGVLLIARQDVRYLGQIHHRLEPYVIRTAFGRLGRSSVTFIHAFTDPLASATLAEVRTVLVFADASGRPIDIPAPVREAARAWPAVSPS